LPTVFVESITDRFFLLASHPNIGRACDEDLRPGRRSFPVREYIIIYRARRIILMIQPSPPSSPTERALGNKCFGHLRMADGELAPVPG